jgi:hypothetical protein
VNSFHKPAKDDDNDTLLFERLQQNAMYHYPNPERRGCPSRETLALFVERPSQISTEDLNELHIFHCGECTRDLIELRGRRDSRLGPAVTQEPLVRRYWRAIAALAACLLLVMLGLLWKTHPGARSAPSGSTGGAELAVIDLSQFGNLRGETEENEQKPYLSLPKTRVNVHLLLPYYSPGGRYRITIGKNLRAGDALVMAEGVAFAHGARTELYAVLAIGRLSSGVYYLGLESEREQVPTFYRVHVK